MAQLDFYAVREDIRGLLHFIFEETDVRVFEEYSEYDRELREFRSYHDLATAFELGTDPYGKGCHIILGLWSPTVTSEVQVSRTDLKRTKRFPHDFRYHLSGIGLLRLHLGGRYQNVITDSYFGHWNEAGARQRSGGNAEAVDWRVLSRISGRIQRHIRGRMAAAKINSRPILRAAFAEVEAGAELYHGYTTFRAGSPEIRVLRRTAA